MGMEKKDSQVEVYIKVSIKMAKDMAGVFLKHLKKSTLESGKKVKNMVQQDLQILKQIISPLDGIKKV